MTFFPPIQENAYELKIEKKLEQLIVNQEKHKQNPK
jgi:hypothetical protein